MGLKIVFKKGFDKMKIKIIDLLNKIANGEELPKKIKLLCDDEIFIYEKEKE